MNHDKLVITRTCTVDHVPSHPNRSGIAQTSLGLSQRIASFPSYYYLIEPGDQRHASR
jgi:hypothetical protein